MKHIVFSTLLRRGLHQLGRPACLLFSMLCGWTAPHASADFSGDYAINPPANGSYSVNQITTAGSWTRTGGTSGFGDPRINLNAPISLTLDTSDSVSSQPTVSANFRLSTVIVEDGWLSFSYNLSRLNTVNNRGGYYLNNVFTQLPSGADVVSNILVQEGDVFGFGVQAGPHSIPANIRSRTILTVTDFAVAPVPEPATVCFGIALVGVCLSTRRRSQVA